MRLTLLLVCILSAACSDGPTPLVAGAPDARPTPDAGPPCATALTMGSEFVDGVIAADDTTVYATGWFEDLVGIGIGASAGRTTIQVPHGHKAIRLDDASVWLGYMWLDDDVRKSPLIRVDRRTHDLDFVGDDVFLETFAVDDVHVYWSSLSSDALLRRRRKDGGPVETVIARGDPRVAGPPESMMVADGRLYFTVEEGDAIHWHDALFALDPVDLSVVRVASVTDHHSMKVIEGATAGSVYVTHADFSSVEGKLPVGIARVALASGTMTDLVTWNEYRGDPYGVHAATVAGPYLYFADDGYRVGLNRVALSGGEPEQLLAAADTSPYFGTDSSVLVVHGSDAWLAQPSDGRIWRLPLDGVARQLCP
jgi:hypothetical protein